MPSILWWPDTERMTAGNLMTRVLYLVIVLQMLPIAARAEINGGESINWWVADSDWIVRGTLTEVWTSKTASGTAWNKASVKVRETLKGKEIRHATFNVGQRDGGDAATAMKAAETEILFFLTGKGVEITDQRGLGVADVSLRNRWGRASFVTLDGKPTTQVFTTDFNLLKKQDEILTAARNAVKLQAMHDKPPEHMVDVPFSSPAHQALYAGSSVYHVVAADASLQEHARKWIESPDVEIRQTGVRSLQYFKSDKNIELLKPLLNDPGFWTTTDGDARNRRRIYAVRKATYQTLQKWGIEAEKPVVEEPLP